MEPSTKEQKAEIKKNARGLFSGIIDFVKDVYHIKDDIDIPETLSNIKSGLTFEGARVWILSLSIIIASIGLNIGSIPIIIGAMLIAPMMSPILGVGVSLGINDWPTLKKSLKG